MLSATVAGLVLILGAYARAYERMDDVLSMHALRALVAEIRVSVRQGVDYTGLSQARFWSARPASPPPGIRILDDPALQAPVTLLPGGLPVVLGAGSADLRGIAAPDVRYAVLTAGASSDPALGPVFRPMEVSRCVRLAGLQHAALHAVTIAPRRGSVLRASTGSTAGHARPPAYSSAPAGARTFRRAAASPNGLRHRTPALLVSLCAGAAEGPVVSWVLRR